MKENGDFFPFHWYYLLTLFWKIFQILFRLPEKKVNSFSSISTNFITSAEFTFGSGKCPPVELGCSHKVDQCPGLLGLHRVAI